MLTVHTTRTAVLAFALALPLAIHAQWPAYPIAGAPRTADGKVDPRGPAPKTADGKPDLSGVWASLDGPPAGGGPPPAGAPPEGFGPPGRGLDPPDLDPDRRDRGPGGPPPGGGQVDIGTPRGGFQNLALHMSGSLLPYQPAALALRNKRFARNSEDHPDAHCLPLNPVQLWFHPQPRKLIQNPREIVFLAEANSGIRQIFTDGRPLPKPADVQPWWFGYSTAKWDGDTLVVESTGFLDDAWIDEQGSPLSNQARVTERIRRPAYGTLEVEITVTDPANYTKPFTVRAGQRLMADDELIEFICGENNTSVQHLVGDR